MWHFTASLAVAEPSADEAAAAHQDEVVDVRVALASGRMVMDRSFSSSTSILEVSQYVAARLFDGTSASRLSLLHDGHVLHRDLKLRDAKLACGDVLTLVKQARRQFIRLEGSLPRSSRVVRLTAAIMGQESPARRLVCDKLAPAGNLKMSFKVNEDFVVQVLVDATIAHTFPHYALMANVMLLVLDTSQPFAEASEMVIQRAEAIQACMRSSEPGEEHPVAEAVRHVVLLSVTHPDRLRQASKEDVVQLAKALKCHYKEIDANFSSVETTFEEILDSFVDKYELQSFLGVPQWLKSSQLSGSFHVDS